MMTSVTGRLRATLDHVRSLTAGAGGERLAEVVGLALDVVEAQSPEGGLACVEVPLLAHEAIIGSVEPAIPVAAAATCVYAGADVLDNLLDHELPAAWAATSPGQVTIAGAALLASLPHVAIDSLGDLADAATKQALHGLVGGTLWRMASGQVADLEPGSSTGPVEALESVAGKSGAELALFAAMGARLASPDPVLVGAFEEYGLNLGIAGQVASDCYDIWRSSASADLGNGTMSVPIAYAVATARGDDAVELREALERARGDRSAHPVAARLLSRLGAAQYAALKVQTHVIRARAALRATGLDNDATRRMAARADAVSLIHHNAAQEETCATM